LTKRGTESAIDLTSRQSLLSFCHGAPIGVLGGLIGLGGAEFRLPVLVGPLRYNVKQAVPLNLAVSLITLLASLAIRSSTLSLAPIAPFTTAILSLIAGAVLTAFLGATLASRLSREQLERVILIFLVAVGCTLILEAFLPREIAGLLPADPAVWIVAGVAFGLAIGLMSSLLGVAGGELIIPTLVFGFGADIKTAGTASLIISLPTVAVGLARYAQRGAFADRAPLGKTVVPMGVGSVVGAFIGGLLVGIIPAAALKLVLGVVLNVSALRIFRGRH
jgi:uncharacterized membrane protein YfcA